MSNLWQAFGKMVPLPPKKTLLRHEVEGAARFLTFSCYQRLPLLSDEWVKQCFHDRLTAMISRNHLDLFAWVIMPEHVHLVMSPRTQSITDFLHELKRLTSRHILSNYRRQQDDVLYKLRDRSGEYHFWQQGGGYDRAVVGQELLEKIRYCHHNPVVRQLCQTTIDWKWSSASMYEGLSQAMGPAIAFDEVPRVAFTLT